MKQLLGLILLLASSTAAWAQDRCGTVEYEALRHQRRPNLETTDQFELWMKSKLSQRMQALQTQRAENLNFVVPIVVHVIHNGEPKGTGTNISDAQILSQVAVINQDFQRMNADTINTPAEFKGVAGKISITFVMAQQDPNGVATNGIVRVPGSQTSWGIADNYTFKALSYWPAEDYLNIWVLNLSGGLLGYTQLPVSSTLGGLGQASQDRLTDGVVIDYQAYGSKQATGGSAFNLLSEYALGRTATHEIGHFFGLRHVWGDVNSCDPSVSTDYVDDTPIQNSNYSGTCPGTPQTECNVHSMYDNYMNYTDDACMNIFSQGQAARMLTVLQNSPRRLSLLTSPGAQPPAPVANDLGIKSIAAPGSSACSGSLTPAVTLRNYGSNTITAGQVQLTYNGNVIETKSFSLGGLAPTQQTTVSFSPVTLLAGTTDNFSFAVVQTNGTTDGNPTNNTLTVKTTVPSVATLPLTPDFSSTPANWQIVNPDNLTTWTSVNLPGSSAAMYMDFYDYENQGASDYLISPLLDLTAATFASLRFDYAYAVVPGYSDQLRVLVSSVCDFTQAPTEVFNKSGTALATAPSTGNSFSPTATQWKTGVIPLDQFIGQRIQIAFVGFNDYGNNLYLTHVNVTNNPVSAIALNNLVSPSPVSCQSATSPIINVTNAGNVTLNSFVAHVYVNGQKSTQTLTGLQLAPGASQNITLSQLTFANGNNALSISLGLPNGTTTNASNDSLATALLINDATDYIPLRQNFDSPFSAAWSIVSPTSGQVWTSAATNYSNSLLFNSMLNTALGEQAWLVSPVLDFSKAGAASVFFQTSYALRSTGLESLQVFSSTDCGETFNKMIFKAAGATLANTNSDVAWLPTGATQWTKNFVNLDSLVGKQNVRLAFVATNGNGNNLYLDNIEFFTADNPNPPVVSQPYVVYGGGSTPVAVTFDLPDRQTVRLQVCDIMGRVVIDAMLPETLNQTYTIDLPDAAHGLYIVRVQTASATGATKVLFGY